MRDDELKRWRGLKDLVRDVVVHGTTAVEKVHRASAARPFSVLKRVPPVARPAADAERVYNAALGLSYGSVRSVTKLIDGAADLAFELAASRAETSRAETSRAETSRAETSRAETSRAETRRAEIKDGEAEPRESHEEGHTERHDG